MLFFPVPDNALLSAAPDKAPRACRAIISGENIVDSNAPTLCSISKQPNAHKEANESKNRSHTLSFYYFVVLFGIRKSFADSPFFCVGEKQTKEWKNVKIQSSGGNVQLNRQRDVNFGIKVNLITHRLIRSSVYKTKRRWAALVHFSFKARAMKDLKSELKNGEIDESLYSRQIYVLGIDAMRKMQNSDILISGLGGVGVEIAKNIILGGVKSVTLHDQANCTIKDLSSQFYLNKSSIGHNRAECCIKQLSELNNYVTTSIYVGELTEDILSRFKVVVLTETSNKEQKRISEVCRVNRISLITADTKGLFGQVFCDFGETFIVYDDDGLPPKTAQVISISKEAEGVVTTEKWHNLVDGDYVTLAGVSASEC